MLQLVCGAHLCFLTDFIQKLWLLQIRERPQKINQWRWSSYWCLNESPCSTFTNAPAVSFNCDLRQLDRTVVDEGRQKGASSSGRRSAWFWPWIINFSAEVDWPVKAGTLRRLCFSLLTACFNPHSLLLLFFCHSPHISQGHLRDGLHRN